MKAPEIVPGTYRHFRGGLYEVIGVAVNSETLEEFVVYRSLQDSGRYRKGQLWIRPAAMFSETVDHEGRKTLRFTKIE